MINYTYSTSAWGDLLTTFNGTSITYDTIGNPLSYRGKTFTWEGRSLVGAVSGSTTMSFEYNDEGIRTSKTVNGVTTNYYLNGSQIIAEETNGNITLYLYDSTGIIGFQYHGSSYSAYVWDSYFYEKNLHGDIVAVYDANGVKKISYTYDAWGTFTASYYNGASSSTLTNPFTYRGYYYDKDLSLYYLNARYYDSVTCRFISADTSEAITATPYALTDKNLYAYCDNNPVMRTDEDGEFWNLAIGAFVGGLISGISSIASQLLDEEASSINSGEFWKHVGVAVATGAVSGAIAASGAGLIVQVASNAILGAASSAVDTKIDGANSTEEYILRITEGAAIGSLAGLAGGKGSASKHTSNSFWRFVKKGNWRYYSSQAKNQAITDGFKAISGIMRSNLPSASKTFFKPAIQWELKNV